MSTESRKIEWIIISILAIALMGSIVFYYYSMNKKVEQAAKPAGNKEVEKLVIDYADLERSYNKAIGEIEKQVNTGDVGIDILKQNLAQILTEIKDEKKQIEAKRYETNVDSLKYHRDQAEQMKDMLKMSKDVLVERLAELQKKNSNLEISNTTLLTRNEKLIKKIEKVNTYVEKEKVKNQNLKAEVIRVQQRIKKVSDIGDSATDMYKKLQQEKNYFEQKLDESDKMIKAQSDQIADLGVIVKKVNVECYFIYEEGNPEEEAKIYLTQTGISNRYIKYFESAKPDVHFDFSINNYMFEEGREKVDFKLYNDKKIELYSTSKSISTGLLQFVISNRNFQTKSSYNITLYEGADNLLIDDKYLFRISK